MTATRSTALGSAPRPTPATQLYARVRHFALIGSTNDMVAGWLAEGTPEVCVAWADAQTHGRGREGRTWQAPPGTGLLLSAGFRPTWLAPERTWLLAALVPLAMAEAAEELAGLPPGAIRLKWPNDLVMEVSRDTAAIRPGGSAPAIRKLGGVLGETSGLGTQDPRVVIGIGVNVDWARGAFPPDLADGMTSLRDASGDSAVSRDDLLESFMVRLDAKVGALRSGVFDPGEWTRRQVTTGRAVDLVYPDGSRSTVFATGVDPVSGGLIVTSDGASRAVHSAEILHVRLAGV